MSIVWDERGGATVVRDGHPQSYVDPDDPLLLVFEYVQQFALVLEALRPDPAPLAVTHVGGAGMTLARWVHRVHPGSPQIVLEPDVPLTELVRRELPLPRATGSGSGRSPGRTGSPPCGTGRPTSSWWTPTTGDGCPPV
ncbi:spermidine synthase [Ornithinimicrobium sp. W1665]|uniref:spermidine synthase n=1 Tax=Ornithinimicrobium sp. W1665 TaxID=3416666 RepID=UPI003D6A0DCA